MIRTRFAPSPTGFLHIGGLRTALYNYLFARKNKGTFILRIEDTDQNRYVEGAIESLLRILKHIGLNYEEGSILQDSDITEKGNFGPYTQSKRTEIYRTHVQELLQKKAAYLCFCTPERLEEMRTKQANMKLAPMYDRTCLKLTDKEIENCKKTGKPYVIRQKIPHGQTLQFHDLIRGKVSFKTSTIDDQILMKSDNFPTYHLANVVDDHLMEITHVIRGEEWLPSTPKHILLYESFGWKKPEFAHIPLLLNKDKTKLSKRQGDVSVEAYLEKGYLKEAIINFIALLGWNPGGGSEEEIFSLEQLENLFTLEKVHKAGAIFDLEKLNWFNFQWKKFFLNQIAKKFHQENFFSYNENNPQDKPYSNKRKEFIQARGDYLFEQSKNFILKEHPEWLEQKELLWRGLNTCDDKILKTPEEAMKQLGFYFKLQDYGIELILNEKMKVNKEIAEKSLSKSYEALKNFDNFDEIGKIMTLLTDLAKKEGLKNGQILWPLRVVLTGEQYSPSTPGIIWALGKKETLTRIQNSLKKFS